MSEVSHYAETKVEHLFLTPLSQQLGFKRSDYYDSVKSGWNNTVRWETTGRSIWGALFVVRFRNVAVKPRQTPRDHIRRRINDVAACRMSSILLIRRMSSLKCLPICNVIFLNVYP